MSKKQSEGDFIEGDIFDPMALEDAERKEKEAEQIAPTKARAILERRRQAYVRVFTAGKRDQADIDIVLADLTWFCRLLQPTYDMREGQHADTFAKMKEGRREVILRIRDFARLDLDTLVMKYTDALKRTE